VGVRRLRRWVSKSEGVLLKLSKGGTEVLPFTLVLPPEVAAPPNVGPAFTAGRFGRTPLEAIKFPVRIGFGGVGSSRRAEVNEMLLGGGPLLQVDCPPFADKFIGSHCCPAIN
jgi:hypothetical protein